MKDRPTLPLYMETAIRLHTRILVCSGEDFSHKSDKGGGKKATHFLGAGGAGWICAVSKLPGSAGGQGTNAGHA